jgi:tetratricopeptide (TPR) repeat protein
VNNSELTLRTDAKSLSNLQLEVPPSIRQLARNQYAELNESQKSVMNILASLARESDLDLVLDLLCDNTEEEEIYLDAINKLSDTGILLSRQIGISRRIRFERPKISDVIYEDLSNRVSLEIHEKIAKTFEQEYTKNKALNLCQRIGEHYRRAEKQGQAYKFLSIAAMELLERGLIAEALALSVDVHPMMRFAKEALTHDDFLQSRCNLLQVQSGVTRNRGEWKENAKALKTLIRYARELGKWPLEMTSSLYLGQAFINLGQTEEGEEKLKNILEICKAKHDRNLVIAALHHLCQLEWERGNTQKCESYATEALMRTSSTEQTISRANSLLSLSAVQAAQGHLQEARTGMEEACEILDHLNRNEKHATVLCNLGEVCIWQGKWLEGLNCAQKAFKLSQQTLHKTGELHAIVTMALAHYAMGQQDATILHAEKALKMARELKIHTHVIVCSALMAIAHSSFDPISALFYSQEAVEHCLIRDPEHYMQIMILLEEICRINAREPSRHNIDSDFVKQIDLLHVPRRIEGWLYLAHYHARNNQKSEAMSLAHKANQTASLRKMLTHSLRARRMLSALDESKSDMRIHEQYTDLRGFLVEPLSEMEQANAIHYYASGLSL